ncbi:MAG TPA: RpiB/LacA/LacB family sugar-phosphate isomerase [Candidatus Methylomirabilis sp.]|nr:RpiB/LacA/LacB family sugar-phosphate isomerase [Candidatus Methylomirabilis sp.]
MRIAIGCDDIGFPVKSSLASALESQGHVVLDLGSFSTDPVDYPDYARAVGQAVLRDFADVGVLLCSSGVGASIAANKLRKVRAAFCVDVATARLSREHDDANVLCLAAGGLGPAELVDIVRTWVDARFLGTDPHARRVAKITQLEDMIAGAEAKRASLPRRPPANNPDADTEFSRTDALMHPARSSEPSARTISTAPPDVTASPAKQPAVPPVPVAEPLRGRTDPDALHLPIVDETLGFLEAEAFLDRLWTKDTRLWKGDPARIANGLGWLTAPTIMRSQVEDLRTFADEIRRLQFSQVVVLGTGAASSYTTVFSGTFGSRMGFPDLVTLDSTDPAAVKHALERVNVPRTLFVVSSKSGTTAATLCLYQACRERVIATKSTKPGMQFVAITDPGTPLSVMARDAGFRHTFLNHPTIGGRFGALSYFGLVPAALIGVDLKSLLDRARTMVEESGNNVSAHGSAPVRLGAALAAFARKGRDKVTFVMSEKVQALGTWLEQLLAESLCQDETGVVPIVDEPLGDPAVYGSDRVFVAILLEGDRSRDAALDALAAAGQPVIRLELEDHLAVGAEFFRWEIATATAGAILGVNPFDEPGATRATEHTERMLAQWKRTRRFPDSPADAEDDGIVLTSDITPKPASVAEGIMAHLAQAGPTDYLAIQAYLEPSADTVRILQTLRTLLRDRLRMSTTLRFGPGNISSTGPLRKQDSPPGLFVLITGADREDLPIPEAGYEFSTLKTAQILGDFEALRERGRRVIRLHLAGPTGPGLQRLLQLVRAATRAL